MKKARREMDLERNQRIHNQVIGAIGNNSASNDATQHKHDMNNRLINDARANNVNNLIESAEFFAAGRKLNLEDDVTMELIRRKTQRGY